MTQRRGLINKPLDPGRFCGIMLAVGLLSVILPIPQIKDLRLLNRAIHASSPIAIVGPSTIDTISKCDRDKRTITDLLANDTGKDVADLSDPGQAISDAINLAAVSGIAPSVRDIVLPIAPAALDEWTTPSYPKLLTFKAINPHFVVFGAANVSDFWSGLSLSPERSQRSFSFERETYPDYRTISATQFAHEKKLERCPETLTHDSAFMKGYYWWMYVAREPNGALYPLIARLNVYLRNRGHRLHVVLLPLNYQLLRLLSPDWERVAAARQERFAAALTARNVHVLDLSRALSMSQFITSWCACTHLSDKGRSVVADAIADDIQITRMRSNVAISSPDKSSGI